MALSAAYVPKRPSRDSFHNGTALHDIFDNEGIKWIAKGQQLNEKQIETALLKGSLTKRDKEKPLLTTTLQPKTELKPTFQDIAELGDKIERLCQARNEDLTHHAALSKRTQALVLDSSEALLDLMHSNRFSPYKLTGLTHFLYGEDRFKHRREQLKMLNNAGTQFTLFQGILSHGLKDVVIANLLNPGSYIRQLLPSQVAAEKPLLNANMYRQYCQQASQSLISSIAKTPLNSAFIQDLLRYFSPRLHFTSAEARLHQQVNTYLDFLMPEPFGESQTFKLSNIPVMNFAQYFKHKYKGSSLGLEGARIIQYVGLIASGTAIQFSNREKGIIIAPKNKEVMYCVVLTGMDGQPMLTPSLREVLFKGLNQTFKIIPSSDLPLKYETHAHEKIWKMHIVHANLKKLEN